MEYNDAAKIIQTYWRLKYMSWLIYKKVGVKKIKKHLDWIDIWGFIIRDFKYRRYEKAHHFSTWFDGFLENHIEFESYCYNDAAKIIQRRFRKRWFNHYVWNTYYKNNIQLKHYKFGFICMPLKQNFYKHIDLHIGYIEAIKNLEYITK